MPFHYAGAARANTLTNTALDPVSRMPEFKICAARVEIAARGALAAMAEGDTLRTLLAALRRILKTSPVNTVARRRQIADAIVERKAYPYA
jgi:hypothetical protein